MQLELDGESLELTDGGIYDNLGLEPVWRDHAVVLVSDAAPSFTPDPEMAAAVWSNLRYVVDAARAGDGRAQALADRELHRSASSRARTGGSEASRRATAPDGRVPGRPDRRT